MQSKLLEVILQRNLFSTAKFTGKHLTTLYPTCLRLVSAHQAMQVTNSNLGVAVYGSVVTVGVTITCKIPHNPCLAHMQLGLAFHVPQLLFTTPTHCHFCQCIGMLARWLSPWIWLTSSQKEASALIPLKLYRELRVNS
mmetsp:Transcript_2011/g.12853  ORF Transcript_2011/g.12853 Transcript_2011/m.12853 type:complete len:139 (-) Transcript_2011:2818-3234(-)